MFSSITNYFYTRRRGFAKAAGFVGGVYFVGRYVVDRLAEVRERVMTERGARDKCVLPSKFNYVWVLWFRILGVCSSGYASLNRFGRGIE